MFGGDLIEHIESETSGHFQSIMVALLESNQPVPDPDYEQDCNFLKEAMDGSRTDIDEIIRVVAGRTPVQIVALKEKWLEMFPDVGSLFERITDETFSWGAAIFGNTSFRTCICACLRSPDRQLAYAVRDCMAGWGTDDTGLITCLVHLSERKRADLITAFAEIDGGGDVIKWIKGDTSGCYERALCAMVMPQPQVIAEALMGAMKGLGTSDNLLINWMCLAKDRMDEVREAFRERYNQELAGWIESECSGDYKDTLIRLANRECIKFVGADSGITIQAPATVEACVPKFNKTFNELCRLKKQNPDAVLVPPDEGQQEMGCIFMYFAGLSSCSPNLDKPGLWDLTNAVGFPPADDGPDLDATFEEWNYSGSGEITWNDFVREMATRINDPGHYEADPLDETEP